MRGEFYTVRGREDFAVSGARNNFIPPFQLHMPEEEKMYVNLPVVAPSNVAVDQAACTCGLCIN